MPHLFRISAVKWIQEPIPEAHMPNEDLHDLPTQCPVSGGELYVSELTCEDSGVVIRGKFKMPASAGLNTDEKAFLKVFLRARGVISTVEKELGMSYPTARAKLDRLLASMKLVPIKEDDKKRHKAAEKKLKILKDLEEGNITAAEAKRKLRGLKSK